MQLVLVEPYDPMIARDGRAFDPTPGARATSLPFPVPSTLIGAARTLLGTADGRFDAARLPELLSIELTGPLLVELSDAGVTWMAPAPADALLLEVDPPAAHAALRKQLVPLAMPAALECDTADDEAAAGLRLVGPRRFSPAKPLPKPPRFWHWPILLDWLRRSGSATEDTADEPIARVAELGHNGPVPEQRTHVGIQPASGTADEGMLFQTRGLEFRRRSADRGDVVRLGMALGLANARQPLSDQIAPLGGERRLARWHTAPADERLPGMPAELLNTIARAGGCRVILLTPAFFAGGFRPTWLCEPRHGVTPRLVAAAVGRAQVASGWDYARPGPKPSRRLAPAGSVFFLALDGDRDALRAWVVHHWLHCVSDDATAAEQAQGIHPAQHRRDGFGLAVIGAWNDEFAAMEVQR
jgi:CRISPR-associated protein Cmr3